MRVLTEWMNAVKASGTQEPAREWTSQIMRNARFRGAALKDDKNE